MKLFLLGLPAVAMVLLLTSAPDTGSYSHLAIIILSGVGCLLFLCQINQTILEPQDPDEPRRIRRGIADTYLTPKKEIDAPASQPTIEPEPSLQPSHNGVRRRDLNTN